MHVKSARKHTVASAMLEQINNIASFWQQASNLNSSPRLLYLQFDPRWIVDGLRTQLTVALPSWKGCFSLTT